ncbi:MAG: hypothetical protein AAFV80_18865 [Bacteroidota bacterium]
MFSGFNSEFSTFILLATIVSFLLGLLLGYIIWGAGMLRLKKELQKTQAELENLKKEHASLQEKHTVSESELAKCRENGKTLDERLRRLTIEKGQIQSDMIIARKERDEAVEDLKALDEESSFFVTELGIELAKAKGKEPSTTAFGAAAAPKKSKEEKEAEAAEAKEAIKAAIGTTIVAASADEKDDLKKISGVGPFIEDKLNALGIFTYEQVGQFDKSFIETVTSAIQFFPGRIERDDWVGQAKALHQTKLENPDALVEKVVRPSDPTDLKVIEGIGPKIEELLKAGGINNWSELGSAAIERLQDILNAAGDRYKIHNPKTWPDQAKLAADGRWDELDEYQDLLQGGKDS